MPRSFLRSPLGFALCFGCAAALTVAAMVAFVLFYSEAFIWCEKFAKSTAHDYPLFHILFTPLCFLFGAGICWKFAPHAVGNGVSKIRIGLKDISDTATVEPLFGIKQIVTKTIASCVAALGGGALGREGPVVHLSAALFWIFGTHVKKIFPKLDLKHWVIAGSAAGFAVAFHTPLAGIVFVIEELGDDHLAKRKFMTLWVVLLACVMHHLFVPVTPLFLFTATTWDWLKLLPLVALVAVICGVTARFLMMASRMAQHHVHARYPFWLVALFCGVGVGILGVLFSGKSFGGGVITLQNALASPHVTLTAGDLIGRLANTFLSVFSGNAGGLLGPSLALGGSIGSVIGETFGLADVRILMTCGMAAFLGGLMAIPLTAAIVVFETTGQSELIVPFFIASMLGHQAAKAVRWIFNRNHVDAVE